METLKIAVESSEHPVFPCALIAGDVVILEMLAKLDYLKTGRVSVAFIDTFHLFPETITFLRQLEVTDIVYTAVHSSVVIMPTTACCSVQCDSQCANSNAHAVTCNDMQ